MACRVSASWLLEVAKSPAIKQRFPFLNTLAHKYKLTDRRCGNCGSQLPSRQSTNQANEAAKILATMPESEVQVFKQMASVDRLSISYMDTRGVSQTVER